MARLKDTYLSGSLILTGANSIISGNCTISGGDLWASGGTIGSLSSTTVSASNYLNLPASAHASGWSNYQAVANVNFQGIYSISGVNGLSAVGLNVQNASFGIMTLTANATLSANNYFVLASGAINISLPDATTVSGKNYAIKNIYSGIVSATPSAGQTIDGQTQLTFSQWTTLNIISNGINWYII